jgi:hypothetical protein
LGSSLSPFAGAEAGFDYFTTRSHYRSIANRILTALGGFNVVVLTGDRVSSGPMLCTALGEVVAGRYTVIRLPYEPNSRQDSLSFHAALEESLPSMNWSPASGDVEVPELLVLYDVDRYPDKQLENVFTFVHQQQRIAADRTMAAVFLASSEFLGRLEHPVLRVWLAQRLFVGRLRLNELGADEIAPFIRHQLPVSEADEIFTDETFSAIAHVSGGDPLVVNRFARRMLDRAAVGNRYASKKTKIASDIMTALPHNERNVASLSDELRRNFITSEPKRHIETRFRRDKGTTLKLGAVVAFIACVAFVVIIAGTHPVTDDTTGATTAPAADFSTNPPDSRSSMSWAPLDAQMASILKGPIAVTNTVNPIATADTSKTSQEDALTSNSPGLPRSQAAPPLAAELSINGATEPVVVATGSPATPTEGVQTPQTVSPADRQTSKSTPSTSDMPPARLSLAATEVAALAARGDALFARGDVASARLLYEHAADAGDASAALKLGGTFDPVILNLAQVPVRGDPASAESWYGRARELGAPEAEIMLNPTHRHDEDELSAAQQKLLPIRKQRQSRNSKM